MTTRLTYISQTIIKIIQKYPPRTLNIPSSRKAAVLILLIDSTDQVTILLTKRNSNLSNHPGQISFPGGEKSSKDKNLIETALRETYEEIGISCNSIQIVARLNQIFTIASDFLITPFLGLITTQYTYNINPKEVEQILMVPLAKILNPKAWNQHLVFWNGIYFKHLAIHHNGELIWGATAHILRNLLEILGDKAGNIAIAAKTF